MRDDETISRRCLTFLPYLLLGLILVIVFFVRIRLLSMPLERDEGEFAYMGQLLLKGFPPFTHAYTMKLPGVSILYAFSMFMFGQTAMAIHLALLIVNGICIALVYLLGRQLFDSNSALVSCTSYAILSLSQSVYGLSAHATHFVVLFALAGLVLLLRYMDRKKLYLLFISGLCFGLALLMKQHAALFIVFAFSYLAWRSLINPTLSGKRSIAASGLFVLGTIIPYALIALWMRQAGIFDKFWFWTVQYASEYASAPTLRQGVEGLAFQLFSLFSAQPFLWLLATAGVACGCYFLGKNREQPIDRQFIFGFLIFSFLSILPGLSFREHYFILILPAVAVLIGMAVRSASRSYSSLKQGTYLQFIPLLLCMATILFGVFHERKSFFVLNPLEVVRAHYGTNPFPEALQIARYLNDHSTSDDRIAVLGSEPEIFFYANRLSATGHIYMYGLMENHPYAEQMQMQMIREIEAARPKYIVVVNVGASWLVRPTSSQKILDWGEYYVKNLYDLVGVIDIIGSKTSHYIWDDKAAGYTPASKAFITVFRRKG